MDPHLTERALGALDRAAVALLTAGGDDMRKLGEILAAFEDLGRAAEVGQRPDLAEAVATADALVTAFLFRDDLKGRWADGAELLSRLISACRDACTGGKPCGPEARAVRRGARERLGVAIEAGGGEAPPVAEDAAAAPERSPLDKDKELYLDFVSEATEHLDGVEVKMVDLESNPGDPETINAVFRGFHTIKGVSGFLDLSDIHGLSHKTESLLDLARRGELALTAPVTDVIFASVDALRAMVRDVADRVSAGAADRALRDIGPLTARIEAVRSGQETAGESAPTLGDVLVEQGKVSRRDVEEAVEKQTETAAGRPLGEILIESGKVTPRGVADALRVQMAGPAPEDSKVVRVDVRKLDGLVDTVGELVIAQALVCNDPGVAAIEEQSFYRNMAQLGRVTAELQKISMSMRMVPVRNTFQKMSRLARDLARKSGKPVAFSMDGENTEIDRNMVEEIHDPLVHMVRNAVDHGVETAEERAAAGKPPHGSLSMRACHRGGCVVISVEDDGRGLDARKILDKAEERGLVPPGASLPETAVFDLIFEPGFSTAGTVTEISGRGVGLDVVRRNVEKLRGTVEVKSRPGRGTAFAMKLPLTLAIVDAIVVRVGSQRYLVATHAVVEALRPKPEDYYTVEQKGEIVRVRGELIPLVRLHGMFSVPGAVSDPAAGLVIVVESEGVVRALLVDDLIGKQQVVIKGLGGGVQGGKGISGGAIMGDGRVGLILDVPGIVALSCRGRAAT